MGMRLNNLISSSWLFPFALIKRSVNLAKIKQIVFSPKFLAGVLIVLGLITRFAFFSNPAKVVFDEVHFGKFVSSYFTGKYYFDIHPPLGKMIIAAGAWLGGYGDYVGQNGVFPFQNIGDDYGGAPFVWFRFFPALVGSLIPLAVFLFMLEFFVPEGRDLPSRVRSGEGVSGAAAGKLAGFLTGLLLVFENSLLVESRLILMDAFLILFGFLGLYFFFRARNRDYQFPLLALSGLLFALSVSIKWTGLGFWGACGLIYLYDVLMMKFRQSFALVIKRLAFGFLSLVMLPFAIYFSVFQIHFSLLPDCPAKDRGNGCDFMSGEFKNNQLNAWQKFTELNRKMWSYNKGISASHEYGSKALGWPLMVRSVYYWVGSSTPLGINADIAETPKIYMTGNPVNWLLGLFGILSLWFVPMAREKKIILSLLYLANFLPFILVKRVLFLYHYLFALIISLIAFSFVFEEVVKNKKSLVISHLALVIVVISTFLFFAPLSYGLPLTDQGFRTRQWSSLWFSSNSQIKNLCQETNCTVLKWLVY